MNPQLVQESLARVVWSGAGLTFTLGDVLLALALVLGGGIASRLVAAVFRRRIAPRMAAQDWLGSYRDFAVLEQVIGGMSRRLSRPQLLAGAMSELERLYQTLSDDFRAFYPQLQVFARS